MIALILVILAAIGAVFHELIVNEIEQIIDPNSLLDASRHEPAIRTTVDAGDWGRLAMADKFTFTGDPGTLQSERQEVLKQHGAVPTLLVVTFGLEGRREQMIRVTNTRPVIIRRDKPLSGTFSAVFDQGGFDAEQIDYDLDDPDPVGQYFDANTWTTEGP